MMSGTLTAGRMMGAEALARDRALSGFKQRPPKLSLLHFAKIYVFTCKEVSYNKTQRACYHLIAGLVLYTGHIHEQLIENIKNEYD